MAAAGGQVLPAHRSGTEYPRRGRANVPTEVRSTCLCRPWAGCGFDSSSFLNLHSHFLLTFASSLSFDGSPNKPQRCSTPADSPATTSRDTAATCWRALPPPTPGTRAMVIKEFLDSDRVNFLIWRFVEARCFCQPCALWPPATLQGIYRRPILFRRAFNLSPDVFSAPRGLVGAHAFC